MGKIMKELTIDERIKILHEVIDNLKGSTKIEFEITAHFIDYLESKGQQLKPIPTGETDISISAYNPKMDKR